MLFLFSTIVFLTLSRGGLSTEDYSTCYFRNGDVAETSEPCYSGRHSMCKDLNSTPHLDVCQTNGLIWNPYKTPDDPYGSFWRTSCTDKTWTSPFCINSPCSNVTGSSSSVFPCDNDRTVEEIESFAQEGKAVLLFNKLCCYGEGCNCSEGGGVPLKDLDVPTASSAAASSTATPPATTPISNPSTATSVPPTNNSFSLGVPLGVDLGVGLTAIGVILGGLWWWSMRRNKQGPSDPSALDNKPELHGVSYEGAQLGASATNPYQHFELSAYKPDAPRVEIDGREVPVEASDPRLS